jgi:hypothetical protein
VTSEWCAAGRWYVVFEFLVIHGLGYALSRQEPAVFEIGHVSSFMHILSAYDIHHIQALERWLFLVHESGPAFGESIPTTIEVIGRDMDFEIVGHLSG